MPPTERKPVLLSFEKPLAELEARITQIRELAEENEVDVSDQIRQLESRADHLRQEIFSNLTPAQRLQVARHPRRPSTLDYVQTITDEWIELHGDRCSVKTIWPWWVALPVWRVAPCNCGPSKRARYQRQRGP